MLSDEKGNHNIRSKFSHAFIICRKNEEHICLSMNKSKCVILSSSKCTKMNTEETTNRVMHLQIRHLGDS